MIFNIKSIWLFCACENNRWTLVFKNLSKKWSQVNRGGSRLHLGSWVAVWLLLLGYCVFMYLYFCICVFVLSWVNGVSFLLHLGGRLASCWRVTGNTQNWIGLICWMPFAHPTYNTTRNSPAPTKLTTHSWPHKQQFQRKIRLWPA